MAAQKPSIPGGTRDFGPLQVQKRKHILHTIEKVFRKYGFMPLETPAVENLETLSGKYGEEGDKLLFKILNSGDYLKDVKEEMLSAKNSAKLASQISEKGLRYDLTVPFARYVVMNRDKITFPFRRYQMQPVWRADRPQKGRYREFWQCDADVVGSDSLLNEIDLIRVYQEAFGDLRITDYDLRINNRKILLGLARQMGATEPSQFTEFTVILDKLDKIGMEGVKAELMQKAYYRQANIFNGLLDYFSSGASLEEKINYLKETKLFDNEPIASEGIKELETISTAMKNIGCEAHVNFDITLARGLGYYTGCIFEVVSTKGTLKSSIGGGGRYDNLTGIFGMPGVSGVGISFGLDRICDVMEELELFPEQIRASPAMVLLCCFDEVSRQYALKALKQLRDAGIASEIYPDLKKLGKQLDYANALQIPYAIIIGDNEMQSGQLMLKDLTAGTQEALGIDQIMNKLK